MARINTISKPVSAGPIRYVGVGVVAAWLGVQPGTVSKWLTRYAGTPTPTPAPDAYVSPGRHGETDSLWFRGRREDWEAWARSRPGQGAPGRPRPRKERATVA
jgi:hypothetical protein